MAKTLYLIRGLPGTGKSTIARALIEGLIVTHGQAMWHEADTYFALLGHFDASKLGEAHAACQQGCEATMHRGVPIIVANTFTRLWEMDAYRKLAEVYGYTVTTITVSTDLDDASLAARNVHGVPVETITRMRARWEN